MVTQELNALRDQYIEAIEKAAKEGDSAKIVQLSEGLRDMEVDLGAIESIRGRLKEYGATLNGKAGEKISVNFHIVSPTESPRAWGKRKRSELARRCSLSPEKGPIFKTRSGKRVGIAAGKKLFLGLPDTEMDIVVLICETDEGMRNFVVPVESLSNVWTRLSRSGGQIKFNIASNGGYRLRVPGGDSIDLAPFLDRYDFLS